MADTNGVMIQYFHWYIPNDGNLWNELRDRAPELAKAGFTAVWIPPAYKATRVSDVGYDTYDLFDLGEFNQRDTVRTKYGTKDQLIAAMQATHQAGLSVYLDTIFNHKNGGDEMEDVEAIPVAADDRNRVLGSPETIKVWTRFTFPGRGDKYSSMKWNWQHFDSVNHNMNKPNDSTIYRFKGKNFESAVSRELGNFDFLMGCDLDVNHPEVQAELKYWGEWVVETLGLDGFRMDAIKHVESNFFPEWIRHVNRHTGRDLFIVGENWTANVEALHQYIVDTEGTMALFDAPLHYNFYAACRAGGHYDMRQILDGTLMQQNPAMAVTIVENHDTQPLQTTESVVEAWFKPLAYALILLRREGYPCVFYADYYGAEYMGKGRDGRTYEITMPSHRWLIDKFLHARQNYAYGDQYDYFDHPDAIGWTRLGDAQHRKAMAVVMSDGPGGTKWMEVGRPHATFVDLTEHIKEPVQTNEHGWGAFSCPGGSVSVWIEQ